MSDADAFEALFAEPDGGREPKRYRGRRGLAITAWILGVLIILVGAGFFILDNALRGTAQNLAASAVQKALPDGVVSGAISVKIGGASVIMQYLSGSFDDVEVDAHSLTLGGITAPAHIVARGVPTTLSQPVKHVSIDLQLDEKALTALLAGRGTVTGFGDGTISVEKSAAANGTAITVRALEKPTVASSEAGASSLVFTTTDASVPEAPAGVDVSAVVAAAKAQQPVSLCVADKLPAALPLKSVTVTSKATTLSLVGKNIVVSRQIFAKNGTC